MGSPYGSGPRRGCAGGNTPGGDTAGEALAGGNAADGSAAVAALEALRGTGAEIRDAGPGDAVAGVAPRWVALPGSTEEVAALMRVCASLDLAAVPTGGGTRLHWGRPPERCDVLVGTRRLDGILEHASGDLVVRTQAGVTAEALAGVLAAAGQELALDVPSGGSTVGGVLATAAAGPRRLRYGTARDLLIGITVVLADGTVARSGGKVVKNVAGYDLGKLFTGSYGTLGIITEAAFRLHPASPVRRWTTVRLPGPAGPASLASALAAAQAEPSAVELDWSAPSGGVTVSALFEGAAADGRAQAVQDLVGACGPWEVAGEAPAWWGEAPGSGVPGEVLLELRVPPASADRALRAVAARRLPARVRGSLASAVLHVALPAETGGPEFAAFVSGVRDDVRPLGGRLTVLAAPPELARRVDPWGPVGALPLMRRVKERFDPGRRMSPGRLAEGL
ncbi:FAD-binding oxidoreductase [Planomonospora parontospora]|uniref:FAD-binding oxidoreductase n=1 Tax=Planomonospora parontospora TaxID=58119 RepID=UPI00166FCCCB|nr:FAD-binding oxidoreductase [Planomonospora parontospora]GGL01881.1 glycolate oxidase [Planomonospora parontospora subsp. antibiotica]GII16819.1 glycolate oxidase [Planomonospora parontospora subsp. antibiotica]